MSLANDDYSKVAFATELNIDKIVGVWEGSFNRTTDVVTRASSFGTPIYLYSFNHGFTRPLFVDVLLSSDGVTWQDGGIAFLAFSDSSKIYITSGFSAVAGTMYYKVIGFWIDEYDTTDPLVPEYHQEGKPILFDSRLNYQKIHSSGVVDYVAGTAGSASTQTITHNLGYRPNVKVFFEAITGEVWPLNAGGATNPFNYTATQDEMDMSITTTELQMRMFRYSNTAKRAWYRIYVDA